MMTVEQIKLGAVVTVKRESMVGRRFKIEDVIPTKRGLHLILRDIENSEAGTRDEKAVDCEAVE